MLITITISKSELLSRLVSVSKIISSKPATPIMENILLDIQDGRVKISAADYLGRMNTSIEGILTDNNISYCIEPKLIIEALKTLPEQPITITIGEGYGIVVKYKGGKFEMTGKPADEFPKDKDTSKAIKLSIPAKVLLSGIEKTCFCSANDELRPVMNGVYFDISAGLINFVASDGHKLALAEYTDESINETINFILPQKIATILKNAISPSDELVDIFIDNRFVRLEYNSESIEATLIEGKYPNYRSVIPPNNDKFLSIGVPELKGALKRVSVFSNQASSLVKLQLSNNQIMISGQDIDFSTAAEEIVDCEYNNDPLAIGFKGHFLSELIAAIPTSDLQMSFSDPSRATLITPVDNKSTDKLTYLLMPMMLND
ncbi:DNA polymerase III subunit beta [Dysgonomonas sp. HDW5B]|uniref:DNA polymerase III subunit beta n=1 Tax=Dysgonomonas sp. HDW5B TaxID=2714927 RepID=UPI00140A36F5|nr:DNA polymerase III subunit beta [Dysgonomonas sp. HDW5B]QIK56124.1 DNA polymerase III subunit beta [Dysgonomonas sp. HDW5B]